jgi:hypothetical protein
MTWSNAAESIYPGESSSPRINSVNSTVNLLKGIVRSVLY